MNTSLRVAMCATILSVSVARGDIDFNRDIRPILSKNCFQCHGLDEEARKAKLRLDIREAATKEDDGYFVIKPGDPENSDFMTRVTTDDEDDLMPPSDSGHELTETQIGLLRAWIQEGAKYAEHWSFVAPKRPDVPALKDDKWARTDIDRLVAAAAEAQGLTPGEEADRRTLIRRLSLDIIGLPPTWEQVEAFVNDQRPDAYERVVDSLLVSERYGEKWATIWLDLARYSDTKGYEKDRQRTIWKYRDWVIQAFNRDLPYDQFTLEQLAGDLIPNATSDQILATAFHRNTMTNDEGGTDNEEFRVAAVKDRVDTTIQVWMGLTMRCAKCHHHKYDPLTMQDYYSFYAIFNQTEDADRADDAPHQLFPSDQQNKQIADLENQLVALRKQGDKAKDKVKQTQNKINGIRRSVLRVPVLKELVENKRRVTKVHTRGNFLNQGKQVAAGFPASFHSVQSEGVPTRADAARWLVSKQNPLTARVAVNRIWAVLFGRGIVVTEEDFGTQGFTPSHPELLDWLAIEFIDQGWSFKRILKTIVMSATYRQSTKVTPELVAKDPNNTWLCRGPRFRLSAETIRDNALAAAGLLSDKMYGPPVMPYQPAGIWQSTYNSRKWQTSGGEDRHRRGLYTFHKRTSPYPSMMTFDATSREVCTVRRNRSNTPLQALVTLNDPVYVEAAQGLARLIVNANPKSTHDGIDFAFKQAVARQATKAEHRILTGLFESRLNFYKGKSDDALAIATDPIGPAADNHDIPTLAAWTNVANVILNLDEFLTKP